LTASFSTPKALGETVNPASGMEGLVEPAATYVTEDTFKLTDGFFRFEALGEKQVKGKKEPVKVYRVIVPSTRRTRFDVSVERGLTPFVGRERELELLRDGFERIVMRAFLSIAMLIKKRDGLLEA
jgi:hypothetical protein